LVKKRNRFLKSREGGRRGRGNENRSIVLIIDSLERHPDNVAAALYGGFVGTYLNELRPEDLAWKEIPLSEVLPAPAGGIDTGIKPPEPPLGIGHYKKFPWSKEIKAIAIIPEFEVLTAKAREVLPEVYTRADVVSPYPCMFPPDGRSLANAGSAYPA
jgi:homoserine kinase